MMTALGPFDLTFLRFSAAGLLLLPLALRRGAGLDRLRWWQLVVLVAGAGAPYTIVVASGLQFAPAAHAGALVPGTMPLFTGILAALFLGERLRLAQVAGYISILAGVVTIAGWASLVSVGDQWRGHGLFLTASLMWACYTVMLRKAGFEALHAAALVAVGSAIMIVPAHLITRGGTFPEIPLGHVLFQIGFQAVVATIVALVLFANSVRLLGASSASSFGALVPGVAALLGLLVLGEVPTAAEMMGIAAVSAGVFLASWRGGGDHGHRQSKCIAR
jgi:drug/metabolite transporter (DMT)-like permease